MDSITFLSVGDCLVGVALLVVVAIAAIAVALWRPEIKGPHDEGIN